MIKLSELATPLVSIPPQDLWKLLIDGDDHPIGPTKFEEEEPGHLEGMFTGLDHMIATLDDPVDVPALVELHDRCIEGVSSRLQSATECLYEPLPKGLRDGHVVSFGLVTSGEEKNCTQEGLAELLVKMVAGKHTFYIQEEYLSFRMTALDCPKPLTEAFVDDVWQKILSHRCYLVTRNITAAQVSATLSIFIKDYYHALSLAKNNQEKLTAQLSLVQDIEQFHGFSDANCRTSAVQLLRKLTLQNRLGLSILPYRDRIDAYSLSQIQSEYTKGQSIFNTISKCLNADPTLNILFLSNRPHLATLVATQIVSGVVGWNEINVDDQTKAIARVSQFLMRFHALNTLQLTTLVEKIRDHVSRKTYEMKCPLLNFFCTTTGVRGIHFTDFLSEKAISVSEFEKSTLKENCHV